MKTSDAVVVRDPQRRPLVIVGAGGHAVSVMSVALAAGYAPSSFVDSNRKGGVLLGLPISGDIQDYAGEPRLACAVAVGDNSIRERVVQDLLAKRPDIEFPAIIHPSAVMSAFSSLRRGTIVMPLAVVGPNSIVGDFCIVNTRSSIDHDCTMGDYASLAPGAVTGGGVRIGARSAVSLGAVVKHGVRIGDDCVLGANSYLNVDLPDGRVAYGSPAREIRSRRSGDAYLK